jgi:hypothetical protein
MCGTTHALVGCKDVAANAADVPHVRWLAARTGSRNVRFGPRDRYCRKPAAFVARKHHDEAFLSLPQPLSSMNYSESPVR